MGIIECIKKGFGLAKSNSQLVLILFGFSFLWNLLNIPFQTDPTVGVSISLIVLGVVFVLASIFMQAGTLGYVHKAIQSGASTLSDFKNAGLSFFLRIMMVGIFVALLVIILTVLALLIVLAGGGEPNPFTLVVSALLAIVGLIGVFLLFLAPYIVVVDDTKALSAIKKSIQTVKAHFIKVIGIGAIMILIGFIIGLILGAIVGIFSSVLTGIPGQIASSFLSSIVNAYLGVATTAAFMAFYLGLNDSQAADDQEAEE